jgi:flagellar hook assembly protein FlgD
VLGQIVNNVPVKYSLNQNYPNPFNPVTTIDYILPENGLVNITIFDMMGMEVNTLMSSPQTAGYKSIQWNATNNQGDAVSAGIYLYRIKMEDFIQTKKMVLLK